MNEELKVIITAATQQFDGAMKNVNSQLNQVEKSNAGGSLKTAFKDATKTIATVGTAFVGVGAAVYGYTSKVAAAGDEIDKNSQKLGVNAEQYQALKLAAEHCGFSMSTYTTAAKNLAKTDFKGNLTDAMNALMQIENPAERSAKACELFGVKAGREMAAYLNGGKDIDAYGQQLKDMGGMMSNEAVKGCAQFQDAVTDLKAAFTGAGAEIGTQMMPTLTELLNKITQFVGSGGIQKVINVVKTAIPIVGGLTAAFLAYKTAMGVSAVIDAFRIATQSCTVAQAALNLVMSLNPIALVIAAVVGLVAAFVLAYKNSETFRNIVNKVFAVCKAAVIAYVNAVKRNFTIFINALKSAGTKVASFVSGVKTKLTNMKTAFTSTLGNIKSKVSSIFSGVYNTIKSKMDAAKNKVSSILNTIKSKFSSIKLKLPKPTLPHITLTTGSKTVLGKNITYPTGFKVSWNAQGGILDRATLIGAGEAGREAILPLDRNTGWMDTFANKVANRVGAGGAGTGTISQPLEIVLTVGGTKFGKACIKSINDAQRQSGAVLLNV